MIALVFLDILVLLALAGILAVHLSGRAPRGSELRRRIERFTEREADLARRLGLQPRLWLTLRCITVVGALVAGVTTGVLILAVVLLALATLGLPWFLEDLAGGRQRRQDRAIIAWVREIAARTARESNLSQILRETARFCEADLRPVLAPLAREDLSTAEGIIAMARRAGSPLVDKVSVLLLAADLRSTRTLNRQLQSQMIPQLERDREFLDQRRQTTAVQRRSAQLIGIVALLMLAGLNSVPGLHDFYASLPGQVGLSVAVVIFAASMWAQAALLRLPRAVRWDVAAAARELDRIGRRTSGGRLGRG